MTRGRSGLLAALALVLSIDYTAHASDDAPDVHVEILDYSQAGLNLVAAREELRKIYERAGINLVWKDYAGYPEYAQFYGAFTHTLTILDLLFHTGPDAPKYIWGWRKGNGPAAPALSHQSAGPIA